MSSRRRTARHKPRGRTRSRSFKRKRPPKSCCSSGSRKRGKREGNAFRYTGGKAIIADEIHNVICSYEDSLVGRVQPYLEPFAGAMSVAFKFAIDVNEGCNNRKITVSDFNPDMTRLWKSLKQGAKPPEYVTEDEYEKYKKGSAAMKGYVGSVFAFGGAMFGAYRGRYQSVTKTKQEGRSSREKLMKVVPLLEHVKIVKAKSYDKWNPKNTTIYCDPPYETASEKSNPNIYLRGFDHQKFWETMRSWSKNNLVFISEVEENIPKDFKIIWKRTIKRSFRANSRSKNKTEVLAIHKSWISNQQLVK
jgi:DNA adenine methylase